MATSSGVRRSSSPELCGGTSRPRGWRWPTGASPIKRASCVNEESPAAVPEDAADDLAGTTVCAMAPRLPRKASIVTILITFRMSISPEMRASRLCDATDMLLVTLTLKRRDYEGMLWRRETLTNVTRKAWGIRRTCLAWKAQGIPAHSPEADIRTSQSASQPIGKAPHRGAPLGEDGGVFIPAKQSGAQIGMGTPLKPAEREE
jgi:hypothetical protein